MLHNTTREQLLQTNSGYVAMMIDAAYFMGWKEYATFTAQEIIDLLSTLRFPAHAVRAALHHHIFRRSAKRNAVYVLPAPSTVRKATPGTTDNPTRDELGEEAFSSLKAYRKALHKALVTRRPARYLRHLLARRLGVCKNTTRNYDRELELDPQPSFKYIPLTADRLEMLPTEKPTSKKYFLFVKRPKEPFFAPLLRQIAVDWLSKGVAVQLMQQTGNLYGAGALGRSYLEGEYADFINS